MSRRERQPMPVANALMQPGRRVFYPTCDTEAPQNWVYHTKSGESWARSEFFVEKMLSKCTRVWLDRPPAATDIVPRIGDTDAELQGAIRAALGPQRLPFDWMWFEGDWPWGLREGVEAIAVRATTLGVELREGVTKDESHALDVSYQVFELRSDGNVQRWPAVGVFNIDRDGYVLHAAAGGQTEPNQPFRYEMTEQQRMLVLGMVMPALWGVGLMNCRNVYTVEVTPEPRRTKKQRRPRQGGVSYHTIVLPSVRPSGGSADPAQGTLAEQPLHKVRGHFKTYTAEAPLLGRHTGTYWWGHQVRGSREHGEVVSDYRLTS